VGELRCAIGDNAQEEAHKFGYNGVYSLSTGSLEENLFVPEFSGLNLELIFDGMVWNRELLFEPRRAPMILEEIDRHEAILHQPPTPFWGLESRIHFTLTPPHYLDLEYTCVPRKDQFHFGWIGLLWASYINGPENKSIYFLGFPLSGWRDAPMWLQFCTQYHGRDSTVCYVEDDRKLELTSEEHPEFLFPSISPLRYAQPFYYGHFRDHVYMIMFDKPENIRFAHSPSGGGHSPRMNDTNPAWDFQFIIPSYKLHSEYGFSARVVYKKFTDRKDLIREYDKFKAEKTSQRD